MLMRFLSIASIFPLLSYAGQPATVSVKVTGVSGKSIEFQVDKPYPVPAPDTHAFLLNQNFEFKPDLERGTLVIATVDSGVLRLFLEPADDLAVNIDASSNTISAEFSGHAAAGNRMLYEFYKKFSAYFDPSKVNAAIAAASSVDIFESSIFDQRMKQMRFVKEYPDRKNVSQACSDFLNNQISYHYFLQLLQYSLEKSGDPTGLTATRLPDIMLTEMKNLQLMDERDMNSPAYRNFLRNYIRYETSSLNSFVKFADYADMMEREYNYALRYLTGEPFIFWLANELFDYCDKASPETVQKLNKALTQSDISGNYSKPVSLKCEAEIIAKVEKKKLEVAPETKDKKSKSGNGAKKNQPFTLIDLKGNNVYLEDFKGKVLYVDFWASWCGPCRQQFPYSKQLHKMLSAEHLKQVVFLYISIDSNEEAWKKAIEKNGIEGFNTWSPGGWSSSAVSHFGVSSIPRYMLIGKDGSIADPNAKRPSSGQEIVNDIVRLIKQ